MFSFGENTRTYLSWSNSASEEEWNIEDTQRDSGPSQYLIKI